MATLSSLVNRVRVELGDLGKSFVTQFVADGSTNRFKLHYSPLDATGVTVFKNGVDISNDCSIEESTGVLVTDVLPEDGDEFTVSGTYYRYFTAGEMETLVNDAVIQHTAHSTDSIGRHVTLETLPPLEEYPVAIYAVTLALYTLATDSAFDIDIQAPDGVTIPRAERYRQLMEMVQTRREQYRELCTYLGIGMYKIDVFSFRRISKMTNRYVPVYMPQEVDDRSHPKRADLPLPAYGDFEVAWPTNGGEFTAYQNRPWYGEIDFEGYFDPSVSFEAYIIPQRGSVVKSQQITLNVEQVAEGKWHAEMSLTGDQTRLLAKRTYWSIRIIDPENTIPDDSTVVPNEIKGGNFFTVRASEVVI